MLKNLVHDQIKILLERMDTHPEEFLKEGKWDEFLPPETNTHRAMLSPRFKHFTKLEQYLIRRKYKGIVAEVLRQRAYDSILETLVFKEEKPETVTYSAPPHLGIWSNTPPTASATISANTLTLGDATLDAETIKHMKEHIKALRKEQLRMGGK